MQKKIIALAIAAAFAAPVAMAADGVTLYGSIDAGVQSRTAAGATAITMGSAVYNSNRWGIKTEEDLGDGMKAFGNLEGGFNTATGDEGAAGAVFDRGVAVGVSSGANTVMLGGNQYSTAFKVINTFDPMGYKFLGQSNIVANGGSVRGGRYDNDIAYTGKFGDVTVMAEKAMGVNGNDSDATNAVGVTYKSGAINAGASYSVTKVVGQTDANTHMSIGGGFNFGDGSVKIGMTDRKAGAAGLHEKNIIAGVDYNVSNKIGVLLAYYKNTSDNGITSFDKNAATTAERTATRMVLGGTYSLSKRTKFYAELDKLSVDEAGTTDSNGAAVGLSTAF